MALQKEITGEIMRGMLGSEVYALVESVSKRGNGEVFARTEQDMMVVFKAPVSRIGSFARLKLVSLRGNTFKAEELA
jgi:tRNA A37 methylthiotransferase MiaB